MVGCRASPELLALYGLSGTVENSNLSRPEALARIPDESQILPKVSEGPNRRLMHFS
jgi:hypothetical protein